MLLIFISRVARQGFDCRAMLSVLSLITHFSFPRRSLNIKQ